MVNPWFLLFIGVGVEVVATTCLKLSEGFTKVWPSVGFLLFFAIGFYLFSVCMNHIEMGIAYAVWAGLGIGLIAIVGVIFFSEEISFLKFLAIAMIIGGAVILNMTSTG
ncbi:DMT family transporter [Methanobacterium petrolearium]|uniref:DMT family transporter n=1 Tax=Methanobacterium petrolearium TaxID=710190 RepID=UPI001AE536AF|nr:multidrug efflux SMR transporter [Methanobacterium petrolearium]MBP1946956.1 multidrug transporter EmrE-like cation transporter [Methanobacterium petrolearium]BDZ70901.1 QacE family quaternary ammonium compound efflux SMR transporter [Methanobacterium petrolearium]